MAINSLYIPLFEIEEVILDKDTGLPLSGGIVNFYRDLQRATPKEIWQISGNPPDYTFVNVGAQFTLSISGTFVDGNGDPFVPYAYPYDTDGNEDRYYVTVVSEGLVPQFTREAVPYITSGSTPPSERSNTENELSNPQFVEVSFNPLDTAFIYSVTGTNTVTPVAPDWDFITTGTGTIEVERLEPVSLASPTNPPYALRINASAGLGSTIVLRQRLTHSPRLFSSDYVSAVFAAGVISGGDTAMSLSYAPSTGAATTLIPSTAVTTDGEFHLLAGNAAITATNTDPASTGYVDIRVTIPTQRNVKVTSFQIVGVNEAVDLPFDQQSTARQIDHLFHFYQQQLLVQPKHTILTAWNFPLNPWQFYTTAATNIAASQYIADQTIVSLQTAASLESSRTSAGSFAIQAVAAAAQGKFALIQYIDARSIAPYWGNIVSSLVRCGITTAHSTGLQIKMRLIYRASVPVAVDPISSWAATDPTFTAGWTALAPEVDTIYTIDASGFTNFAFNGFTLPAAFSSTGMLGIVLYTVNTLNSTAASDTVYFDRISLVPNEFAVDSPPQTYDEVLRNCFLYYEKSYAQGVLPNTAVAGGCLQAQQGVGTSGGNSVLLPRPFGFPFKGICRTTNPTITIYNPVNAGSDQVYGQLYVASSAATGAADISLSTNWDEQQKSSTAVSFEPKTNNSFASTLGTGTSVSTWLYYHYTKDGRLGLVA